MARDRIVIASDHAGFELKSYLQEVVAELGYEVVDLGTNGPESVDYPDYAHALAAQLAEGVAERGILVCGTGIGIGIAANRHPGVRCGVCHDVTTARLTRLHNDANVLALGARIVGPEVAADCVRTFLATDFEGGRHRRRVDKLDASS